MPRATLRVTIPEAAWIHDLSIAHPETTFRVISVLSARDRGTAVIEILTGDPVPILSAIDDRDDVAEIELLWTDDEAAVVQIETTNLLLLLPILQAGVPIMTPFDVVDGEATWELATSRDRLSALGSRLSEAGIEFDIRSVREEGESEADRLLTDRQRELLLVAAEQGYYDTPRRATLTEVSESLGIAKATGSDVLHRAEGSVIDWFIDEHAGGRMES